MRSGRHPLDSYNDRARRQQHPQSMGNVGPLAPQQWPVQGIILPRRKASAGATTTRKRTETVAQTQKSMMYCGTLNNPPDSLADDPGKETPTDVQCQVQVTLLRMPRATPVRVATTLHLARSRLLKRMRMLAPMVETRMTVSAALKLTRTPKELKAARLPTWSTVARMPARMKHCQKPRELARVLLSLKLLQVPTSVMPKSEELQPVAHHHRPSVWI